MIPSVLATQLRRGIEDYLRTTFQISTPLFHRIVDDLLDEEKGVFQGPYLSVALPFTTSTMSRDFFSSLAMPFQPHLHQEKAFTRITDPDSQSTIVATGTGSGKTECFLYPLLEYCYKNRNVEGIKAIVIYPMNALATDQAKRFASEIAKSDKLRNNVNVGLYVGQKRDGTSKSNKVMTPEWVIDDRETLRRMPPDILLTNYKMLDYMLVRARDAALWKLNGPDTLKYIVVDEMHTFDGAQGTDLACLIRRLKHRLKTPKNHLCCVGTSATLGGAASTGKLREYAKQVFEEGFSPDSVITETRQTPGEFLGDNPILQVETPGPDKADKLDPENFGTYQEFVSAQHELWFGERITEADFKEMDWRNALCGKLKSHLQFQNLVRVLGSKVHSYPEVLEQLRKISRYTNENERLQILLLDSLLALISEAKKPADSGSSRPFLEVRLQLWARELTRMVCECSRTPRIRFSDDLTDDQLNNALPMVNCRDCGATGWLGILRANDDEVKNNLHDIYRTYFSLDPKTALLFPHEEDGTRVLLRGDVQKLCGNCLHLMDSDDTNACPWCSSTDLVRIFRPDTRRNRRGTVRSDHICPFCGGTNTLAILGARAASITSVAVSQVFASTFNDDKKLLAFSDSVQDASHRAGFFGARTYRFNLRGALQKYMENGGTGQSLTAIPAGFSAYWKKELGLERYLATFTAPNMTWMEDFEYFEKHGKLPSETDLPEMVDNRVNWEIWSEYGFNARIGRTLEKSGCSVAHVDSQSFSDAVSALLPVLQNEIGDLRQLKRVDLERFLYGIITNLKNQGGIYHTALGPYIESFGSVFRIGQRLKGRFVWMPYFGFSSRLPRFLTTNSGPRFDLLESTDPQRTTWYQAWGERNLIDYSVLIRSVLGDVYRYSLDALVEKGLLKKTVERGADIWGLTPEMLKVSTDVAQFRCTHCGHTLSVAGHEGGLVEGLRCLRITCKGTYQKTEANRDFYASLYRKGDVRRIFSEEHTGLLMFEERDRIEKDFINPEGKPCAPNLLSCTPTLEMGINIGDLSSAVLCSVPPRQANYLQRIGRVGRRDGNALSVTIAGGKPHDLYFFAEPKEMLAGEVEPPGVFLSAPAVLQRQLTAFCFDSWIAMGVSLTAIPSRLGDVLNGMDSNSAELFPHNYINYVLGRQTELLDNFVALFGNKLGPREVDILKEFFVGDDRTEGSLTYRIVDSLSFLAKQRAAFRKRITAIGNRLRQLRNDPARDKTFEEKEQELQRERSALNALVKSINDRETYGWLTDEGLLPNYAFPESGVTLRSIIYRRKKEADAEGSAYQTWSYEFERPAVAAIKELAPENTFYAGHRKVEIDQIDLSLSDVEPWRFCSNCTYMRKIIGEEHDKSCPNCGSLMWSDEGQKRNLVKLKQVFATSEDAKSRIGDDSEERDPVFYNRQLLVNFDEKHIAEAYRLDSADLPFGFEFIRRVTLREVNFGRVGTGGETVTIAGVEMERSGFSVCRSCGRIMKANGEIDCAFSCSERNKSIEEKAVELLYLYREYPSEAIRILLPTTSFNKSDEILHSFIASLQLGLKQKFGGSVEHLQTCLHEEPIPESSYRKRYLVLYDTVPGGTGYLQQLMVSGDKKLPENMVEVLEMALRVMENCECRHDPNKDGCYRCLYAYRNSFDMRSISRTRAIELLSEIVKLRDNFVRTENLKKVDVNSLFDSELEARFVEALRKSQRADRAVMLKKELVNRKPGYFLKVRDVPWFIEPQVELSEKQGVSIPVSVDFVFWPGRESLSAKPIAVFTDGFTYHKDRIGLDCAQRMALLESGRFDVWSFSWNDITTQSVNTSRWYEEFFPHATTADEQTLMKFFDHYLGKEEGIDLEMRKAHQLDSFAWFITYLGNPQRSIWEKYAFVISLLYKKSGTSVVSDEEVSALVSRLPVALTEKLIVDQNTNLVGHYSSKKNPESNGFVELLMSIEKNAVNSAASNLIALVAYIDDSTPAASGFERTWNGFLRIANITQFLQAGVYLSRSGQEAGRYAPLSFRRKERTTTTTTTTAAPDDTDWREIFEYAAPEAEQLLKELKDLNVPPPTVGFELADDAGQVVATAELAWESLKVAFLLDEEDESVPVFPEHAWKVGMISNKDECLALMKSIIK